MRSQKPDHHMDLFDIAATADVQREEEEEVLRVLRVVEAG